jgi:hypothetical protein
MESPPQNQQQNNKNTLLKLTAIEGSYTTFDNSSIYYQGIKGMAAETFVFNQEGKVMKSIAHYE